MSETIEPGTALTVLPVASLPVILAADQNDILGKLWTEIDAAGQDGSTEPGRRKIKSAVRKIGIASADFDRLRTALLTDSREKIKSVNAEWKIIEERLDELKEQVRAPLTAFENREKTRVAGHETALAAIAAFAVIPPDATASQIDAQIVALLAYPSFDWEEFEQRAAAAHQSAHQTLVAACGAATKREAEARELLELREQQRRRNEQEAIEAQRLRDEQIARDAAEAARIEAEARATAEREEVERVARAERDRLAEEARRQTEVLERAEREKAEAEERERRLIDEREKSRVGAHRSELAAVRGLALPPPPGRGLTGVLERQRLLENLAVRNWQEFAEEAAEACGAASVELRRQADELIAAQKAQAEADEAERTRVIEERERLVAEESAKQLRLASEREEKARTDAIEAERQRVAREQAAQKAEDDRRAADKAHRAAINREAMAGVMLAMSGVDPGSSPHAERIARAIIEAAARGQISHVSINYAATVREGVLL